MTRVYTRPRGTLEERFWPKVDKNGPLLVVSLGVCWVWIAYRMVSGYGRIGLGKAIDGVALAHVVAFFLAHGRWPDPCAMHLCDNPSCVKAWADEFGPAHVIEGTHKQNMADMTAKGRRHSGDWNAAKTHCPKGHPYAGENLILLPNGERLCRICRRANDRRRYWEAKIKA